MAGKGKSGKDKSAEGQTKTSSGLVPEPIREPWERQSDEPENQYAAFCAYRDMGPLRSLRKAAATHYHRNTGVIPTSTQVQYFKKWSTANGWVERAGAYDEHLDELKRAARAHEAVAIGERQAHDAAEMAEVLIQPVRAFLKKMRSHPENIAELESLSLERLLELTRLVTTPYQRVVKVERLAYGEATELVQQNVDGEIRHGVEATPAPGFMADILADPEKVEALAMLQGDGGVDARRARRAHLQAVPGESTGATGESGA